MRRVLLTSILLAACGDDEVNTSGVERSKPIASLGVEELKQLCIWNAEQWYEPTPEQSCMYDGQIHGSIGSGPGSETRTFERELCVDAFEQCMIDVEVLREAERESGVPPRQTTAESMLERCENLTRDSISKSCTATVAQREDCTKAENAWWRKVYEQASCEHAGPIQRLANSSCSAYYEKCSLGGL